MAKESTKFNNIVGAFDDEMASFACIIVPFVLVEVFVY